MPHIYTIRHHPVKGTLVRLRRVNCANFVQDFLVWPTKATMATRVICNLEITKQRTRSESHPLRRTTLFLFSYLTTQLSSCYLWRTLPGDGRHRLPRKWVYNRGFLGNRGPRVAVHHKALRPHQRRDHARRSREDCDLTRFASRRKHIAVFGKSGVGMDGAFASNPRIASSRTQF